MFGRGNWAIFGVRKDKQDAFETNLNDATTAAAVSQLGALQITRNEEIPAFGINPYDKPRGDEPNTDTGLPSPTALTEDFRLGPQQFGFWFVINDYEDVTDPKSKMEGVAYENATKPFKFLNKDEKKHVESLVKATAVASRKQFPVLIDFVGERVYALTTSEEEIGFLRQLLEQLGAETFNLSWQFGGYDWTTKFLNVVQKENKFVREMTSRADDLRRFRPDEIEKLEDKLMESIVSGYFAMSELETGKWAGLSTPAKIRLFAASEPSSEASVSTAFTLLSLTTEASVASAAVVFQSLDSKFNKKTDEEKQFRTDLFTIDINDKVNISDAGAAALRGFDMPQYKKDMKRHGKDRGSLGIRDYWFEWLIAMKEAVHIFVDNVTETLQIDKDLGLLPYTQEQEEAAAAEV